MESSPGSIKGAGWSRGVVAISRERGEVLRK